MLDISDFTSLALGAVTLRQLVRFGLAAISDSAYLPTVNQIFYTEDKPQCITTFSKLPINFLYKEQENRPQISP
ncbi:MAG: sterol carrier protein domain-containing protein [Chloroflexi bacterium]|nr:sterol carrier protein domain-containing protein [Chloroflexota bacterium]